jgi:hypothetical protein
MAAIQIPTVQKNIPKFDLSFNAFVPTPQTFDFSIWFVVFQNALCSSGHAIT